MADDEGNATEEMEKLRKATTNPAEYAALCDYLGMSPEKEDLYDSGTQSPSYGSELERADRMYAERTGGVSYEIKPDYAAFVREVESRGVPKSRFEWRGTKELLLKKHFHGQFPGKQRLEQLTDAEIDRIFKGVLSTAREEMRKDKGVLDK